MATDMRAACGQRVQATFGAPGKIATQVRRSVLTRGALETGQVGSHRQLQLISKRRQMIGRDRRQFGKVRHDQTLHPPGYAAKPETYRARQIRTSDLRRMQARVVDPRV